MLTALAEPFFDPGSRTWWPGLMVAFGMAVAIGWWRGEGLRAGLIALWPLRHRSAALDVQLLLARQLLLALGLIPGLASAWWLATHLVRWLDGFARPELAWDPRVVAGLYGLTLFALWDVSRYAVHRLMHEVPALWAFHQVHHSAEVLNPLTFHRVHPVESLLYELRGVLVTGLTAGVFFWLFRGAAQDVTLFGVNAAGLLLNVAAGNLRHSEVWWSWGWFERFMISPAQHQLHHGQHGPRANYGTWLALWDRLGGTWVAARERPVRFGLPEGELNHGHDLLSAWFGPFVSWIPGRRLTAASALVLAGSARAQDPDDTPDEFDDDTVIVYQPDGTPRVAGSAHVVGEEELERYEYDDIGRVLSATPGVYVRGEDGWGLRPNLGIRGANSDRSAKITLLEDGVPLAPAPYAAPAAYYFPMPTRLVGVEVFKGPAATQHGPHTVGGAVNVLTRKVPDQAVSAVDLAYGMRETAKLHGWAGLGGERGGVLAEVAHLRSDGFKHIDGGGEAGFERSEVMLKGRLTTDPALARHHAVELKLGWASERSHETYLGLHVDDYAADPYRRYAASADDLMRWGRTQAELSWQADVAPGVRVRAVAYHHALWRTWRKFNRFAGGPDAHDLLQRPEGGQSAVFLAILRGTEDSTTPEQTVQIGTNDRRFQSYGALGRVRWRLRGEHVESQLEAGVRLHGDLVDRLHTEEGHVMRSGALQALDTPLDTLLDARTSAVALALHVHEDLAIGGLHLLPGARTETIRTTSDLPDDPGPVTRSVLLPGFATLAELGSRAQIFAGIYRGFSPVAPGQPSEVKPETSWNLEAGARVGGPITRAELVGYLNEYVNLTGQCTFSGGCQDDVIDRQFNGGQVRVLGLEAVAAHELHLPGRLTVPVQATYTLTQSTFRTGFLSGFPQFGSVEIGDRLPYVPEHQGGLRLALQHARFSLGVGASARSAMRDSAGQGPFTDGDVPAQVLLDLAGDATLTDGVKLYATVVNATNSAVLESWRPFGARPTAPFQAMIGIKLSP